MRDVRRPRSVCFTTAAVSLLIIALVSRVQGATYSSPTLPIQATITRDEGDVPTAPPLLTTYWAVSATARGLVAAQKYRGGTYLSNQSQSDVFMATGANYTITNFAASTTTTSFVAIANQNAYFFATNRTSCWLVNTLAAPDGQSFTLFSPTRRPPLVVGDTVFIGTSSTGNGRTPPWIYAVNMSTGQVWWSIVFDESIVPLSAPQYANFVHAYDATMGLFLQTSPEGSSTVTYVYTLAGVGRNMTITNADNPDYTLIVINSTSIVQITFSMTFYQLQVGGSVQTAKITFSTLGCSLFENILAPFYFTSGRLYAVCVSTLYVVNVATLTATSSASDNNEAITMGATFPDTTSIAKYILGTTSGVVYRVMVENSAPPYLSRIYTDPDMSVWQGESTEVGLRYITGYYPMISSWQQVPNKATPMLAVGTRIISTASTLRGVNPLGVNLTAWQLTLADFRITMQPACDGLHCVVSSGTDPGGMSAPAPSVPLRLHTADAMVTAANSTIGRPTATADPFYTWAVPTISPLGVAYDYDAQKTLIVASNGLFSTTSTATSVPTTAQLCTAPSSATLAMQPAWVYDRINFYTNVTYNTTILVNQTQNQTFTNTTTNVTSWHLVNVTVNQTQLAWRIDTTVKATKALCYVDATYILRCYNTTTLICNILQLCDVSGGVMLNSLQPVNEGDGSLVVFCTGAAATVGAQLVNVKTNTLTSFGTRSTSGVRGAIDSVEGALYVPEEQSGAAPTSEPATKRFLIRKYWLNSTTAVWSAGSNLSLASNLFVDPVVVNVTVARKVRAVGTVLPSNKIRGYTLISFDITTGQNTSSIMQLDNANEPVVYLSSAWTNTTSMSSSAVVLQPLVYLVTPSFFAVVNATVSGRVVFTLSLLATNSFRANIGFFDVKRTTPIVNTDFGVAVIMATRGPVAFNFYNGSLLWQFGFNSTFPTTPTTSSLLLQPVNRSAIFTTQKGVAVADIVTGVCYWTLQYTQPAIAAAYNGTYERLAAVASIPSGVISDYRTTPYYATVFTTEGLFAAPFYVEPNGGATFNTSAVAFQPLRLRTWSMSPRFTLSNTTSMSTSNTEELSRSQTPTDEVSSTVTPIETPTINPLESRTHRMTDSARLTATKTPRLTDSQRVTPTISLPRRIPTRTHSMTMTPSQQQSRTLTEGITQTSRLSPTRSGVITLTSKVTESITVGVTLTQALTLSLDITASVYAYSPTVELSPTISPYYTPPKTRAPTPGPTPVPPNLAAPPEEVSYAWVAGPAIGLILLVGAISLAVIAKKKRSAKKAARALANLQRGEDYEEQGASSYREMAQQEQDRYNPPNLEHDADAMSREV